jgi:copper(I)-binding protein
MKTPNSSKTRAFAATLLAGLFCAAAVADVVGSDGWSRATPPGSKEGVGYLVLTNNGDEERSLMVITSTLSDTVRIRRSSIDSDGVTKMWPVGFLKIGPGETVRFDPNGLHVMFSDLKKPLKAGDKVPLTLQFDGFEKSFTLMLEVKPLVPAATPDQAQHRH